MTKFRKKTLTRNNVTLSFHSKVQPNRYVSNSELLIMAFREEAIPSSVIIIAVLASIVAMIGFALAMANRAAANVKCESDADRMACETAQSRLKAGIVMSAVGGGLLILSVIMIVVMEKSSKAREIAYLGKSHLGGISVNTALAPTEILRRAGMSVKKEVKQLLSGLRGKERTDAAAKLAAEQAELAGQLKEIAQNALTEFEAHKAAEEANRAAQLAREAHQQAPSDKSRRSAESAEKSATAAERSVRSRTPALGPGQLEDLSGLAHGGSVKRI